MNIAVIIIAKNEEERIERCLKSLSFCRQIIVVDNGSTDKTVNKAKKFGASIIKADTRDFSKLRDIGLQKAKEEWVFYIDADEIATEELARSIQTASLEKAAYKVKRKNFYLGNHEWPTVEHLERLFYRAKLKGWTGELHESPVVEGDVGELDGFLLHYSHRNLTEMVSKTIEWSGVEAELRFRANHPKMSLWRFPRVMAGEFFNWYIKQGGWRSGTVGLIESIYQSFSIFITYAKLWELQKKNRNG